MKQESKYNSFDLSENIVRLSRNQHGLVNGASLFGLTCTSWREGDENTQGVESILNKAGIVTYNPRIIEADAWERNVEKFIKAEGEANNEFSVLVFGLYAKDLKNMGAGTFTEIGFSILTARLRGQVIAINIEDGIENTLEDPNLLSQFTALKEMLVNISQNNPDRLMLLKGADTAKFSEVIKTLVQKQSEQETALEPFGEKDAEMFLRKQAIRLAHQGDVLVTDGGSSVAAAQNLKEQFQADRKRIRNIWGPEFNVTGLADLDGTRSITDYWDFVLGSKDLPVSERKILLEKLYKSELFDKQYSDVILWHIHGLSFSLGAATEIGPLGDTSINNGQYLLAFHEPIEIDKITDSLRQLGVDVESGEFKLSISRSIKVRKIALENFLRLKELVDNINTDYGVTIMTLETDFKKYLEACTRTRDMLTGLKKVIENADIYSSKNDLIVLVEMYLARYNKQ